MRARQKPPAGPRSSQTCCHHVHPGFRRYKIQDYTKGNPTPLAPAEGPKRGEVVFSTEASETSPTCLQRVQGRGHSIPGRRPKSAGPAIPAGCGGAGGGIGRVARLRKKARGGQQHGRLDQNSWGPRRVGRAGAARCRRREGRERGQIAASKAPHTVTLQHTSPLLSAPLDTPGLCRSHYSEARAQGLP